MKLQAKLSKEQEELVDQYPDEWTKLVTLYTVLARKCWLQNEEGGWYLSDSEDLASRSILALKEGEKK